MQRVTHKVKFNRFLNLSFNGIDYERVIQLLSSLTKDGIAILIDISGEPIEVQIFLSLVVEAPFSINLDMTLHSG